MASKNDFNVIAQSIGGLNAVYDGFLRIKYENKNAFAKVGTPYAIFDQHNKINGTQEMKDIWSSFGICDSGI